MFRSQRRKWFRNITSYPRERSRRARPSVFSRMWHRLATSVSALPTQSPRLQAKLTVGAPNDKYEQEADHVADQVMRMPEPGIDAMAVKGNQTTPALQRFEDDLRRQPLEEEEELALQRQPLEAEEETLQRQPLEEEEEETLQRQPIEEDEETLQTKKDSASGSPASAKAAINRLHGGGTPLSDKARNYFEPRFGQDFGDVRIHTGAEAEKSARSVRAKAFTLGRNIVFGTGQFAPESPEGKRLLAHELTHVIQQGKALGALIRRSPDEATATIPSFNLKETYDTFNKSLIYTLSRFYIERSDIHVKKVYDFKGIEDTKHPAYYNPNDRTIYFSTSGFEFAYNEYVVKKKIWSIEKYRDVVIETAIEEAFHAYQDTPRHRSRSFSEFEKKVVKKLLTEMQNLIEKKVIKTHKDFKIYIPYFTEKYLPTETINTFMKENLPGMHRLKTWQLNARDEIMNQWLQILDSCYFRARGLVSAFARLGGKPGLKEEKGHKVSLIEKQANLISKIKKSEVKLWLFKHYLEKEKDPKKMKEMKLRIKMLEDTIDPKHVPGLIKRHKKLEDEFMKLGYSKKELERSAEIAKELMEINNRLAYFTSLTSGLEAVFKKKGLLI